MARKRVVYFVITIAALWLMGSPPASLAQLGIERMVWMGGVALVWVLVMFFLLVRATVASLDRNLQPSLTMTPVAEERMPDALRAAADRFAALGFTRATPPLAVALRTRACCSDSSRRAATWPAARSAWSAPRRS